MFSRDACDHGASSDLLGLDFLLPLCVLLGLLAAQSPMEKRRRIAREMRERNRAARDKVPANTET